LPHYGRWTLQGVAGVEFGNTTSATVGDIIQTYEIKTRFFDQVNLAYYLQDNFKVFVGHRYLGGKHAAAFGGEYGSKCLTPHWVLAINGAGVDAANDQLKPLTEK
jgi:hypothetical protein